MARVTVVAGSTGNSSDRRGSDATSSPFPPGGTTPLRVMSTATSGTSRGRRSTLSVVSVVADVAAGEVCNDGRCASGREGGTTTPDDVNATETVPSASRPKALAASVWPDDPPDKMVMEDHDEIAPPGANWLSICASSAGGCPSTSPSQPVDAAQLPSDTSASFPFAFDISDPDATTSVSIPVASAGFAVGAAVCPAGPVVSAARMSKNASAARGGDAGFEGTIRSGTTDGTDAANWP
ncbi:hypothetical protein SAMN04488003_10295 [Loktanella fryxellensis]|uniref:Uncharacterized protein n=1 Tax=Loktanella fryxellensis TaxID=245187 RepID=A0A1H7ZRA6_9RHOB|nr:hypothetical protein SAMN04488003_10295 [Loktanella fryxellensis]